MVGFKQLENEFSNVKNGSVKKRGNRKVFDFLYVTQNIKMNR
jgi:hypothetical protein